MPGRVERPWDPACTAAAGTPCARSCSILPADAAAIRDVFERDGELSAAIELRRAGSLASPTMPGPGRVFGRSRDGRCRLHHRPKVTRLRQPDASPGPGAANATRVWSGQGRAAASSPRSRTGGRSRDRGLVQQKRREQARLRGRDLRAETRHRGISGKICTTSALSGQVFQSWRRLEDMG